MKNLTQPTEALLVITSEAVQSPTIPERLLHPAAQGWQLQIIQHQLQPLRELGKAPVCGIGCYGFESSQLPLDSMTTHL